MSQLRTGFFSILALLAIGIGTGCDSNSDSIPPSFVLLSPGLDTVRVGDPLLVKAEIEDNEQIVSISLAMGYEFRMDDPFVAFQLTLPDRPSRYTLDTLLVLPENTQPSELINERVAIRVSADDGSNSNGRGTVVVVTR